MCDLGIRPVSDIKINASTCQTSVNGTPLQIPAFFSNQEIIYKQIHHLTFTQSIAQYPLYHVTYAHTKFEVTTSKGYE